uniref:Uncharacterized protein n=1 Tax=viral metagenome TaxID=1070528 RepID=A0A6C0J454_9ZZZZ
MSKEKIWVGTIYDICHQEVYFSGAYKTKTDAVVDLSLRFFDTAEWYLINNSYNKKEQYDPDWLASSLRIANKNATYTDLCELIEIIEEGDHLYRLILSEYTNPYYT